MPRAKVVPRKATVGVERNGAFIRIDDVPVTEAADVLRAILDEFRLIEKSHSELIRDMDAVPGGMPVDVQDDEWADEGKRKRVGF